MPLPRMPSPHLAQRAVKQSLTCRAVPAHLPAEADKGLWALAAAAYVLAMEEAISRMAGSQNGSYKTISELAAMVARTGRPMRQRTTTYETPAAERITAASASDGVCAAVRGPRTPLPLARAL